MTNREFFVSVSKGVITDDVMAHATEQIAKLDASNAKRAEKQTAKSKENEPLKVAIYEYLVANGTKTSPDIAVALTASGVGGEDGVSTSKASSMCRQMVDDGRLTVTEIKVPKKGKLKAYTAIVPAEDEDEDDTDGVVQATDGELNSMF